MAVQVKVKLCVAMIGKFNGRRDLRESTKLKFDKDVEAGGARSSAEKQATFPTLRPLWERQSSDSRLRKTACNC